ncbi:MAG TPA: ATP-binding protein, partial [Dyella sp.]
HLGLGLYVVRLVAERHDGSADARNLEDGSGVVFSLRLRSMPRTRL